MRLPEQFISRMQRELGVAEAEALCAALETEPSTSVRLNPAKMAEQKWGGGRVAWSDYGYLLGERPAFTLDPDFHAGAYYVQEASSQFAGYIVSMAVGGAEASKGLRVLDMCAAPGGKSAHYATLVGERGLVVANEINRSRAAVLADNARKWGLGNMVVTCNDSARVADFEEWFDVVAVDAPCSGEGMFRKDEGAIAEWSMKNVQECAERQCDILDDVWDALKPGGILIYSTCTFNREENEKNALWIAEELGAEILPIPHDPAWGITEGKPGYHFYPHKTKGEGFYLCAFRKAGVATGAFRIPKQKNPVSETVEFKDIMRSWLQHPDQWIIRQQDRFVVAYPAKYKQLIEFLNSQFICISTGFGIGELRGKTVVPQHALAMLKDLNTKAFNRVELSLEQALSYLRCEALTLPNAAAGVLLLTYENVPLGFVKNVGNHCNNLYPKEWRIRKL